MKKKIAVEVSGYMRKFFDCVQSWDNFIFPNSEFFSFDFFVHTYEYHGYSAGFIQKEIYEDEVVDVQKIKNVINPVEIILEPNINDFDRENRMKLMFRKIHLCHQIVKEYEIKNNFTYDGYIRIRPDLIISEKLIIPEITENMGIFNQFAWGDHVDHSKLCDQMFICDSYAMEKCSNIFQEWDSFIEKHSETTLFNQINKNQIKIIRQNFTIHIHR